MLFLNSSSIVSATEIASVTHQPTTISEGTVVTIEVSFTDDSNVTSIQIQYCALEPIYTCYFPKTDMTAQGDNLWSGTLTVKSDTSDTVIGYELYISLNNGSTIIAPDSSGFLGMDNIAEPIDGTFYFTITLATTTNSAPINIGLGEIAITFSIIVLTRNILKRRKMN